MKTRKLSGHAREYYDEKMRVTLKSVSATQGCLLTVQRRNANGYTCGTLTIAFRTAEELMELAQVFEQMAHLAEAFMKDDAA